MIEERIKGKITYWTSRYWDSEPIVNQFIRDLESLQRQIEKPNMVCEHCKWIWYTTDFRWCNKCVNGTSKDFYKDNIKLD